MTTTRLPAIYCCRGDGPADDCRRQLQPRSCHRLQLLTIAGSFLVSASSTRCRRRGWNKVPPSCCENGRTAPRRFGFGFQNAVPCFDTSVTSNRSLPTRLHDVIKDLIDRMDHHHDAVGHTFRALIGMGWGPLTRLKLFRLEEQRNHAPPNHSVGDRPLLLHSR
jgi:hypothetical protein